MDSPFTLPRSAATDLAKAPAFDLGPLRVEPSTRLLSAGAASETLEPRAMRVLVALGQTEGQVLSRDDLIDMCWDGQIVGDAAINRAVALVRHALDTLGGGAVVLETITKVGFRIVLAGNGEHSPASASSGMERLVPAPVRKLVWTRRAAAAGVIAAGAGTALAYAAWNRPARHVPDPRALELFRRGQATQFSVLPGTGRQSMELYKQAVAIDPNYADAWGALAVSYRHAMHGFIKGEAASYPRLMASAAHRALALDPDQVEANFALIDLQERLGSWQADEANLRGFLRRFPDYWYAHGLLNRMLQEVGRFEEGIKHVKRGLDLAPNPVIHARYARGLHYANRDHEADNVLDQGLERWPAHPILWTMRYEVLIGSERYAEAAAFVRDPRTLPEMAQPEVVVRMAATADALATGTGKDALIAQRRSAPVNIEAAEFNAPIEAALGEKDRLFALLAAYYFGGAVNGVQVPQPGKHMARPTTVLFAPQVLALRADPRHAALLERTGLEDYWRKSGTKPDFRKART